MSELISMQRLRAMASTNYARYDERLYLFNCLPDLVEAIDAAQAHINEAHRPGDIGPYQRVRSALDRFDFGTKETA